MKKVPPGELTEGQQSAAANWLAVRSIDGTHRCPHCGKSDIKVWPSTVETDIGPGSGPGLRETIVVVKTVCMYCGLLSSHAANIMPLVAFRNLEKSAANDE